MNLHLPFIDLHRHLDGSVRLETILELGLKHNLPLPATTPEGLRPFVQVTTPQPGVMAFIAKFKWMTAILVDEDACRRVAYENVEDVAREGIDYVELRFSPLFMAQAHSLDPRGVVEAVCDGIESGRQHFGVMCKTIGILSRHFGPEQAFVELESLLSQRDRIVALDLAGDEANYPGEWFEEHFQRARDAGWHVTVHAGEICGPQSVWQALEGLGAERIGHAVHAVEDAQLISVLAERRIGVECSLTSNVQTSTVSDYAAHPIHKFLEEGILATINTDDPGISAITLPYEYEMATQHAGLNAQQLEQIRMNAVEIAFLNKDERKQLLTKNRSVL